MKEKLGYIFKIIKNEKNWPAVLLNNLHKIHINKISLRNGITIYGGPNEKPEDLAYEIFIEKVYFSKKVKIAKGDVVMDIGANIGAFSLLAAKHGAGKIYAIEPVKSNAKLIRKNFRINKFSQPVIIEKAVSSKSGKKNFYLGDLGSHGSLFNQKKSRIVKINTVSLEDIFKKHKIGHVDFLKIDCEGSEGEIIKNSKANIWKKISKIALEYHDNVSVLNHKEIVNKFRKLGFKTQIKSSGGYFGYIYAWKIKSD